MPDFINLNNELQELLSLLEEDMSEKIMTKKQAKRKKALRAKKRAEKLAKQQAEQKKLLQQVTQKNEPQDDAIVAELVDDGGDDNNNNNDNNDKSDDNQPTGTALVPYKEGSDESSYENMSETFKNLMETIGEIMKEFETQKESALSAWKSKGENSICPIEEWEKLNTALTKMKTDVENLINNADTDSMEVTELILLDRFTECFNGYLDKAQKQILSAKPNLDTKMLNGEVTDVTTTDTHTEVTKTDNKKNSVSKINKDTRNKKDLVTYKTWYKGWKKTDDAWKALWESIKTIGKLITEKALKPLYELSLNLTSWITDNLFTFLTSPIAKDFVKTLMYSNPITAMIYDGKFGSFGIAGSMDKVKKSMQDKIQNAKGLTDPSKVNPDNYDTRHFPKSTSKMLMKEIKWNMEHNKELIYCINVSYNHPEVRKQDKGMLKKACNDIFRKIKAKNIEQARKDLTQIVSTLDEICDYMNWSKPSSWMNMYTKWVKANGNTAKDQKQIDKYAKSVQISDKKQKLYQDILQAAQNYINTVQLHNNTDAKPKKATLINALTSKRFGYDAKDVEKVLQNYKENFASTTETVTKNLQQLCENALA